MVSVMRGALGFLLVTVLCTGICSAADMMKGDRLCKFFTDGTKTCMKDCKISSVNFIEEAGVPKGAVSDSAAMNMKADVLLQVTCQDQGKVSNWSKDQGYLFDTAKGAGKYAGSCVFNQNAQHSWNCRLCTPRENNYCFNGGQDGYKVFYKQGWTEKSANAIAISRD